MASNKVNPKLIKFVHFVFVFMFIGGILVATILSLNVDRTSADSLLATMWSLKIIFDNVVSIGALSTLAVGTIFGVFTKWGFFKHRWVTAKWLILLVQIAGGVGIIHRTIESNLALASKIGTSRIVQEPTFATGLQIIQVTLICQLTLCVGVVVLSVWKPVLGRKTARNH